ncbi:uncharacterized protein LOC129766547 [Toxorhynchites rutilus septentrionalis]|uniref:uncharacterized protein LOC129766547 n=1 Tax=Toxorhynchites rutilus septentrionalis TaxID=329112 RepID=UPI0024794B19|nr:uncharacterized protein LOC129766547 [Toxorhynchites rutilus septentrionalis]
MKDLGQVEHFMGMRINVDSQRGRVTIDQTAFAERILLRFGMESCNSVSTPVEPGTKLDQVTGNSKNADYRQAIGCLMYLMLGTRPDLCYAINLFSRYQDKATNGHWTLLKRVLRYVKGTTSMQLVYQKRENVNPLEGYVDSDCSNDSSDRRSTTGFVYEVFGNAVSWATKSKVLLQCLHPKLNTLLRLKQLLKRCGTKSYSRI